MSPELRLQLIITVFGFGLAVLGLTVISLARKVRRLEERLGEIPRRYQVVPMATMTLDNRDAKFNPRPMPRLPDPFKRGVK